MAGFGLNDSRQEEQSPVSFYETRLLSGEEAFFSGEYKKAIKELEIAAFGLFHRKFLAAKAYILISLSYYHLEDRDNTGGFLKEAASFVNEQELRAIELNIDDSDSEVLESLIQDFDVFSDATELPVIEEDPPSLEEPQKVNLEEKAPPIPEKIEQEKKEQERIEQEKIEQAKKEQEKIEQDKIEQAKIEQAKIEQEKIEQAKKEQEKIEQEKKEQDKKEQEKKVMPLSVDERIAQLVEQRKKQQSEQLKEKSEVPVKKEAAEKLSEKIQEKDTQIEELEELFIIEGPVQEQILSEIRIQKGTNSIDIGILFFPYTQHQVFEITDTPPKRIVIDIHNITGIKAGRSIAINDFGITSIRTGMFKDNIARVVFDAEEDLPSYRIEKTEGGLRVVIEKSAR